MVERQYPFQDLNQLMSVLAAKYSEDFVQYSPYLEIMQSVTQNQAKIP
jgi:hypothetical protein